ncbi:MAG: sulfatase, partial [Verrucomicrobia bacterium]|nr:sulfatase [Verrucomicrobiota bacterium]
VREVAPGSQPNILLFLVDDMGWQDTELQLHNPRPVWNDLYHTPSMLRLAEQGMKFTDAYAASPVCSPTRTGIMSGQNPARTHITDWTRQTGGGGNSNTYLKSPAWRSQGLQPGDGFITLPSLLQAAGYRTIHVGKAHFGGRNLGGGNDPTNLGFDVNIGGSEIGGPYSYFSPWINNPGLYPNMEDQPQGKYITKALTDKAKGAINDALAAGQPFFMNMAHYAVHAPLQGDPEFTVNPEYAGRPGEEIHYAAMVESMDESLGDLLDHLVAIGAADNTIVLFVSDNGGLSSHSRSFSGDPWIRDWHNAPIRSGKGAGYEGGYRVPMIVAWAGQDPAQPPLYSSLAIAPGSTCNEPVHTDDFYPTILTLAGVDVPQPYGQNLDGQDLSPLFKNEPFERDGVLLWHYPHQWYENIGVGLGIEPFTAIRDGDWKLIYFYADGVADGSGYEPRWELYNLTLDIDESNNRATAEPVRLAQMARAMVRELDGMDAQYPISISSNQPVPPTMPVAAGLDADGDGLDDNTEDPNQNGLVDSGETDPDNDNTDGDGTPDGAEIRIGTNPLDPDSFFRLVGEWDGALEITWPSAPGASFTIHSSDNLTNWTGIVTNGLPASSGTTTSYNLGAPGNDQGFYRIELED